MNSFLLPASRNIMMIQMMAIFLLITLVPSTVAKKRRRLHPRGSMSNQKHRGLDSCQDLFGPKCTSCVGNTCNACELGFKVNDAQDGCEPCICNDEDSSPSCFSCSGCDWDFGSDTCLDCADFGTGCRSCEADGCTDCPDDDDGNPQAVDEDGVCIPCPLYKGKTLTPQKNKRKTSKGSTYTYDCTEQETEFGNGFFSPTPLKNYCCERCADQTKRGKCNKVAPEWGGGEIDQCTWAKPKGEKKKKCEGTEICYDINIEEGCNLSQCVWRGDTDDRPLDNEKCYQRCEFADLTNPANCKKNFCVSSGGRVSCERCKNGYHVCREAGNNSVGFCVPNGQACPPV